MAPAKIDAVAATSRWLRAHLAGVGGGAYLDLIPASATLPAVRYSMLSSRDIRSFANQLEILMTYLQMLIVVSGRTSNVGAIVDTADALQEALDAASGETDDLIVFSVVRESPYSLTTIEEGQVYRQLGGIYGIRVQAKAPLVS